MRNVTYSDEKRKMLQSELGGESNALNPDILQVFIHFVCLFVYYVMLMFDVC